MQGPNNKYKTVNDEKLLDVQHIIIIIKLQFVSLNTDNKSLQIPSL